MKRTILALALCAQCAVAGAWAPQGDKIKTRWAAEVTPENVWQSYPRPQLQRSEWQNLNGLWKYDVTPIEATKAGAYDGEILVPFAIESSLSGVQKTFLPTDKLWYSTSFTLDKAWRGKQIVLHFGSVDYACEVFVNGKSVGTHVGGNLPFSFDVTKYIKGSGAQALELSVTDPTDTESVSRGKQQLNQQGIWYTPVSGIWKTVWVEAVNDAHITRVVPSTVAKTKLVTLDVQSVDTKASDVVEIEIFDGEKVVKTVESTIEEGVKFTMENGTLWSPSTPKLYHYNMTLKRGNKVLDEVRSYFTMREVNVQVDKAGYKRIFLNNEPIFQCGTLDQGWWPDGLLTPPSEEAMIWDMIQLKDMGFNTIRKHIKVEPELYYYYADSLGLMMWQDAVSGFSTKRKDTEHVGPYDAEDWDAPESHRKQWEGELYDMIDYFDFYQSITTWVVFNEGWGQYDTKRVVNEVMDYAPDRIICGVTGWTDRNVGDLYDAHNYPNAAMKPTKYNGDRVSTLGEFGGYGWAVEGHLWNPDARNWGYKNIDGSIQFTESYARSVYDLKSLIAQGLSASIYTQTTDVEGEVNGLITYDREMTKLTPKVFAILHEQLYEVEGEKFTQLIADGQGGQKNNRLMSVNGAEAKMVAMPFQVRTKGTITSTTTFNIDKDLTNYALWTNMKGRVKVWINGALAFEQDVNQPRHYNQYNMSDCKHLFKMGENEFKIEVSNGNQQSMNFDYGLIAY